MYYLSWFYHHFVSRYCGFVSVYRYYVVICCRCVYRCSVTLYIIGVSLTIPWFYYDILYVYRLSWFFGDFVTTNCRCIDVYRDSVTIYRRDRDLVDGHVTGAGQCRGHGSLLVGYDRFWLWLLRQHLHYIHIKLRTFCTFKSILTSQKLLLPLGLRKKILLSLLVLQVSLLRTEGKLQSGGREELADWLHRRYCCHGDRDSGFAGNAEKNRFGRTSVKSHALNFRGMLLNPFNT